MERDRCAMKSCCNEERDLTEIARLVRDAVLVWEVCLV